MLVARYREACIGKFNIFAHNDFGHYTQEIKTIIWKVNHVYTNNYSHDSQLDFYT